MLATVLLGEFPSRRVEDQQEAHYCSRLVCCQLLPPDAMRVCKKMMRGSSRRRSNAEEVPHLLLHVLEIGGGGDGAIAPPECEVDGKIWGGLPQEIVDKVLLVLPPAVQFRFRAVCKRWRALLSSPRFLQESASASPLGPSFICAFEYRPGRVEEAGGRKFSHRAAKPVLPSSGVRVHKVPLTFLPAEFQRWGYRCVVAQDGLICVKTFKIEEGSGGEGSTSRQPQRTLDCFCVLNPITRLWKVLPLLDTYHQRYQLVKVQADKCGGGFKVIVVCGAYVWGNLQMPWMAVYSSLSGAWRTLQGRSGPVTPPIRDFFSSPLFYNPGNRQMGVQEVEDSRLVTHADLVLYGRDYFKHQLIGHGEDVFNVGEVSQQQQNSSTTTSAAVCACFGIWKLERGTTVWHLVSKTPEALLACLVQPVFENARPDYGHTPGKAKLSFGGARVAGGIVFLIIHKVHYRRPCLRSRLGLLKPRRDFMQDGKEAIMCSDVVAFHLVKRTWQICFRNVARWITGDFYDALGVLDLRLNDYL